MSYLYSINDTINIYQNKVGIGTTYPLQLFHVEGGIYNYSFSNNTSNFDFNYSTISNIKKLRTDIIDTQNSSDLINVSNRSFSNINNLFVNRESYTSNLNVYGSYTFLNTTTSNTKQLIVSNVNDGPALIISQNDITQPVALFNSKSGNGCGLIIDNYGKIGVGISEPTTKFHLRDTSSIYNFVETISNDDSQIKLKNNRGILTLGPSSNGPVLIQSTLNEPIIIGTNSNETLYITPNNCIGFGRSNVEYPVDISSTTMIRDVFYLRTNGMNTITYSYGDRSYNGNGDGSHYIGLYIDWTNVTVDNKLAFKCRISTHVASYDSIMYYNFVSIVSPMNDVNTYKPKEIIASDVSVTNNSDFYDITHKIDRRNSKGVTLKVQWKALPTDYMANLQIEVFANYQLGNFIFSPISA